MQLGIRGFLLNGSSSAILGHNVLVSSAEFHHETHGIYLCLNICNMLRGSEGNLLICAVFLFSPIRSYHSDSSRGTLLMQLQRRLIGENKFNYLTRKR